MNRRTFIQNSCLLGFAPFCSNPLLASFFDDDIQQIIQNAPDARFWQSANAPHIDCTICHSKKDEIDSSKTYFHPDRQVKCLLCAQECIIPVNKSGKCRVRMNIDGRLKSLVYGRPVSMHIDPIEKKPFYHFLPGNQAFSLATVGCPLSCKFCQNWEISQAKPGDFDSIFRSPEKLLNASVSRNIPIIAFTYNEPTVFFEYLVDIAEGARKRDTKCVLISCGFMNPEPLAEMCNVLDAIKIDLKGFSNDFYRNVCGAELKPVLRTISQIARSNVHLEIVNLVVPTLNDSEKMLTELCRWIFEETGPDVPVHFTRFHPDYQMMHLPPTPISKLERARNIALDQGLNYPFVGNVPGHPGNNTYCPSCGQVVIERSGFFVLENRMQNGHCPHCGNSITGVWN